MGTSSAFRSRKMYLEVPRGQENGDFVVDMGVRAEDSFVDCTLLPVIPFPLRPDVECKHPTAQT